MDEKRQVLIFTSVKRKPLPRRKIRKITEAISTNEKLDPSRKINLICCSDYTTRKLNRRYRHIDRATDVLSFHFDDDDILGEIYISTQRIDVQARRFGVSFNDEFIRVFIHGLLHLAGYDHTDPAGKAAMEAGESLYR